MEQKEHNWTLLPFFAGALAISLTLCLCLGYKGWGFAGMLVLLFLASLAVLALLFVLVLWMITLTFDHNEAPGRCRPFFNTVVTYVEGLVPAFFRTRIYVSGKELVPQEGCFLLVGNHRSGFDPLVTGWALRRHRLAFITKPSIQRIPVVGPFIHRACYLGIDRDNDRAALKTIMEAISLVKTGEISMGIYPEGTRNTGPEPLPFRNGAFKIAQKAKVPIVVVRVQNTEQIMKRFPWRSTDVRLEVRGVLDAETAAGMNTGEIGEIVRQWITFADC